MVADLQPKVGFKQTKVGWIPKDWDCVPFKKIVFFSQYGLNNPSTEDGIIPIIGMAQLVNGKITTEFNNGKVKISQDDYQDYRIRKDDLLFNRTNSYDLVGKTSIALDNIDAVFASYIVRFRINKNIAYPYFVNYYFNGFFAGYQLKNLATKGVSQCNINPSILQKYFYLPLPSFSEQKRIVQILSTWDRVIESLEKLIDAKQRMKKGLMQQLLTGKMRFPEYGDPINRGNDLPSGWKIKQLGSISKVLVSSVDKKIKKNENLVYLCNYMDVYSNDYIHKDIEFMRATAQNIEVEKFRLKKGDVLLTKDSETSDDIASMAVVIEDIQNLLCGYHLAIIRPVKKEADSIFLSKTLSINDPHRYFQSHANGVTRFGLTISSIKNVFVRLPILEEQQKIRDVLVNVDEEISLLEKNKNQLREQKQGLMQKLLTGKVRAKV